MISPEYDRILLARMLENPGAYTSDAIAEQIHLLREADDRDAAQVGTVSKSTAKRIAVLSAGGEVVATLLPRDNEFDEGDVGPYFSAKDWSALRHLPPGTKLYTTPAGAGDAVDAARYRFLRNQSGHVPIMRPFICIFAGSFSQWIGEQADHQIDAAIDACRKGEGK